MSCSRFFLPLSARLLALCCISCCSWEGLIAPNGPWAGARYQFDQLFVCCGLADLEQLLHLLEAGREEGELQGRGALPGVRLTGGEVGSRRW
jgi:hypothetical protein